MDAMKPLKNKVLFSIQESNTFVKIKKKIDPKLYNKIKNFVYPQLKENPFFK